MEKNEESQKAFEKQIKDYTPQTDGPKKKDGPTDIDEKMEDTVKTEKGPLKKVRLSKSSNFYQ